MLRIMAVDDEAVHLMNLIGLIQILKPSYIVFSAKDGKQALDIMNTFQVDLLITDIKMPNMDGLTLIQHAKKLYPDLHTLILSGYGEFEYARKAIDLGVDGYLLKTLDQEELLRIMDDLEWKIKSRQEQRLSNQAQQQVIEKMRMDQLEREVEQWVLGYVHPRRGEPVHPLISTFDAGLILCAKSLISPWSETVLVQWKERISRFLQEWGHSYTFRCSHLNDAVVTLLRYPEVPSEDFYEHMRDFCRQFKEGDFVMGISSHFDRLSDRLDTAFHQATEACEYVFYTPHERLFIFRSESAMQPFILSHIRMPLSSARELLLSGEADPAAALLIRDMQEYISQHRPYPSRFKEVLLFCFWRVCSDLNGVLREDDLHRIMANIDQLISNSHNMLELEGAIHSICQQFCAVLAHQRKSIVDLAMEEAAEILHREYARDWSLDDLAARVHFNPSYFSSLFKQHFGIGYSDYLSDIRMEQAARILRESNIRVGQLAQAVGYQNTTYFIKTFRRKYGVTPNEYRRGVRCDSSMRKGT